MTRYFQNMEITKVYKLSMFVIGLSVVLSFSYIFSLMEKQKEYASLVAKSAQQRFYFERLYALLEEYQKEPTTRGAGHLHLLMQTMRKEHSAIASSLEALDFEIENIYTRGYKGTLLEGVYERASALSKLEATSVAHFLRHHKEGLFLLDSGVRTIEKQSDRLQDMLLYQGVFVAAVILAVAWFVSAFIFTPLLRKLTHKHATIAGLNTMLSEKIMQKTRHLEKTLDIVNQYVYTSITDKRGVITYVSDAFCELSGYSREELLGKTHRIIKHPDNPSESFKPLWDTITAGQTYKAVVQNLHKDGSSYWIESYIVPDVNEEGKIIGYQAFRRNVTDKKMLEELNNELEERVADRTKEIEKMAVTDHLTGLYNRHRFSIEMQEALDIYKRYKTPVSLAVIDIDFFKKINDTYGHAIGDYVLVTFAKILRQKVRSTDKPARWGGEEFVVLFPSTELDEAVVAVENFLTTIRKFHFRDVGEVTFSAGVTKLETGDDAESFMHRADLLLYDAKNKGRNRVCY